MTNLQLYLSLNDTIHQCDSLHPLLTYKVLLANVMLLGLFGGTTFGGVRIIFSEVMDRD